DVMNKQREIMYKRRRRLLEQAETGKTTEASDLHNEIAGYISDEVASIVSIHAPQQYADSEFGELVREFSKLVPFDTASQQQLSKQLSQKGTTEEISEELTKLADRAYKTREKQFGVQQMRFLERVISLTTLDERWMEHLDAMEGLRDGIWLRGDKQTVLSE
ncbi:MAG: preprotein translocase subunit SecA, partial [Candidatus Pacebacteria bacterium CG10_big_fil_rev_8_21_14_0_10_45_6]